MRKIVNIMYVLCLGTMATAATAQPQRQPEGAPGRGLVG